MIPNTTAAPPLPFKPDDIGGMKIWINTSDITHLTDPGGPPVSHLESVSSLKNRVAPNAFSAPRQALGTSSRFDADALGGRGALRSEFGCDPYYQVNNAYYDWVVPGVSITAYDAYIAEAYQGSSAYFLQSGYTTNSIIFSHYITRSAGNIVFRVMYRNTVTVLVTLPEASTLGLPVIMRSVWDVVAGTIAWRVTAGGSTYTGSFSVAILPSGVAGTKWTALGRYNYAIQGWYLENMVWGAALTPEQLDAVDAYVAGQWGI